MKAEKEIKIPGDLKVSVGYLKNQKCLIIENKMDKKFVFVSNSLGLLKKQKTLLYKNYLYFREIIFCLFSTYG
jgi:hypothetical protein